MLRMPDDQTQKISMENKYIITVYVLFCVAGPYSSVLLLASYVVALLIHLSPCPSILLLYEYLKN